MGFRNLQEKLENELFSDFSLQASFFLCPPQRRKIVQIILCSFFIFLSFGNRKTDLMSFKIEYSSNSEIFPKRYSCVNWILVHFTWPWLVLKLQYYASYVVAYKYFNNFICFNLNILGIDPNFILFPHELSLKNILFSSQWRNCNPDLKVGLWEFFLIFNAR